MSNDDAGSGRPAQAPGWYRDPSGQGEARYWNGTEWTASVSRQGITISVPVAAEHRFVPPVAGTEYVAPAPAPSPQVMVVPPQATPPARQPAGRSPFGALLGGLLLAAAVVALIVVLVRVTGGDDDPTEPTAPPATEQPSDPAPEQPSEPPADPSSADATTPADGSG